MKCAIYTRVSTDEQGTSIINQKEYFKDYITRHNLEIFDIYSDEAFSGTETTKRLSFQRLLEDGKNKYYDVLLAKSYSRFGRNQRETLTALAELFEHGIRIIFVEDGLDSMRDKGQFGLFAWLAEQESRKISERIRMTWQVYNKDGKVHSCAPPYGYDFDTSIKNFVVNEKEAEVVKMIFDMYLRGEGSRKIAIYLNNSGIPSKRNGKWTPANLRPLFTNVFYLGHLTQGKSQTIDVTIKKKEKVDKNKWTIHKNNHEAIISEDVFYKVNEEYKKRSDYIKQLLPTRHSSARLFSNLVTCKICGAVCVPRKAKRKTVDTVITYSCSSYETWGKKQCEHSRNGIMERDLIPYIENGLKMLAVDDFKIVRDYFKQINTEQTKDKEILSITTLDKQIEEQTRLSLSLLNAFTEGILGKNQFKLQNEAIEEKLSSLMKQKEEALLEQNKIAVNVDDEGNVIKAIKVLLETDSSQWTNEMMKKVIDKICIDMLNDDIEIRFSYSISSK